MRPLPRMVPSCREGQVVCSFECASAIGKKQTAKAREAAKARAVKRQRESEKRGASAVKQDWLSSDLTVTTKPRLRRHSTPTSALVMLLCHASVAARPTRLICMAASGTAATSKRSALTLSCVLKSATLISSANRAMPGPVVHRQRVDGCSAIRSWPGRSLRTGVCRLA